MTEIMAVPATLFRTVPRKFGKQSKSIVVYADVRKESVFLSFRREFMWELRGIFRRPWDVVQRRFGFPMAKDRVSRWTRSQRWTRVIS